MYVFGIERGTKNNIVITYFLHGLCEYERDSPGSYQDG